MSFQEIGGERQARFDRGNTAVNDEGWGHFTKAHEDEIEEADGGSCSARLQPYSKEFDQNSEEYQADDDGCGQQDNGKC